MSTATFIECLLHNYIDKDFQSMLKPLYIAQTLFLSTKYTLRYNFITPKSILSNAISFIGTTAFVISHICVIKKNSSTPDKLLNYAGIFDVIFYSCALLGNFINIKYRSPEYVDLILKIMRVHKIIASETFLQNGTICNLCIYIPIIFEVILLGCLTHFLGKNYIDAVSTYSLIGLDAEIFESTCVMVLINIIISDWIVEVDSFVRKESSEDVGANKILLLSAYFDIMDSFKLFKLVFQVMLFYHTVSSFLHSLIYVYLCLILIKSNIDFKTNWITIILISVWVVKSLLINAALCLVCQLFYNNIEKAQTACIRFTQSGLCTKEEKRICKNIMRVHSREYGVLCAFSLYKVDAQLPLRLASLIATYTIVILQFFFF